MGWSIGYDEKWDRDVGYGVSSVCDHPGCNKQIDRGLSYVCGGEPKGGDHGCGLYFCEEHHSETIWEDDEDTVVASSLCERCAAYEDPFEPKPDTKEWIVWKLTDQSWKQWREENPDKVKEMAQQIAE